MWHTCDTLSTAVSRTARGQRVPRAEARRRIVDAANRLLATRRFADLSVDAVMAEAGLARTVFYRHFDSLPHLVLSEFEAVAGDLFAELETLAEEEPERFVRAILERAVEAYAAYCAAGDRSTELTAALLRAGAEAGHNRSFPHPEQAARALNEMNNAYLIAALGREPRSDPKIVLETLVDLWRAAL